MIATAEELRVNTAAPLPLAKDIAKKMIGLGAHVIFFPRPDKGTTEKDWPNEATRDLDVVERKTASMLYANVGVVGKPDGCWFFDNDEDVLAEYEAQYGKIESYRVRSVSGGTHLYLKQTDASREMGNINGTDERGKETWSARVKDRYVVAAGSSAHPDNDRSKPETFYTAIEDIPVVEAPNTFITFLKAKAAQNPKKMTAPQQSTTGVKIPHHGIHPYMLTQAGKLRQMGLDFEQLEPALQKLVEDNCEAPINAAKVTAMARSICKEPAGVNTDLAMTQTPQQLAAPVLEPVDITLPSDAYPVFPHFVMTGTSIYNNFVKPVCDQNSRIDYFMWLPAMILLLNYVGTKLEIEGEFGSGRFRGSIYTVLVGRKGKTNKSSSVEDAMKYFSYSGMLQHANRDTKTSDGRTLVWTAGSAEGLGINMQKTNCKNAVLFYDEFSTLVQKASIESSSMVSNLLTMYEAGKFDNSIKSTKETFSHEPDTYCTSLITCTTDGKFSELWARFAGSGSETGLFDRFFFVLQPEALPKPRIQQHVNTVLGSIETKKLIDKAVLRRVIRTENSGTTHPQLLELVEIDNRLVNRAEKWAVALAIDLGREEVDDDCVERACAIVKYEIAVKKYLQTSGAQTREASIQLKIRQMLERNKGRMAKDELKRKTHYTEYGTSVYYQAYYGLVKDGTIREEGTGGKNDKFHTQLLRTLDTGVDE